MSVLLVGGFIKFSPEGSKFHRLGQQYPGLVKVAFLLRYPEVPLHVKLISIVLMQEFTCQFQSARWLSKRIKSLLKKNRLVPGDAMYPQIPYAFTLGGKRELLQNREKARQHFLLVKAGKPDA